MPNFYRLTATSPAALGGFLGFQDALGKRALDPLIGNRIALALAEANGCDYCLSAQTYRVRQTALLDDAEITANRNGASNDIKAHVAVRFATKLVRDNGRVSDADVTVVQRAGYSDVEIIADVALSVFTNTVNQALKTDVGFPRVAARKVGGSGQQTPFENNGALSKAGESNFQP